MEEVFYEKVISFPLEPDIVKPQPHDQIEYCRFRLNLRSFWTVLKLDDKISLTNAFERSPSLINPELA